ncbi:MAG: hypothetical protein WD184_07905 [Acidimicrobiia bacterium]
MNPLGLVGSLLLLGAVGCGVAAIWVDGEGRSALIITAFSLLLPALIMRGLGRRLGKMLGVQPDFMASGQRGTATITSVGDTGVTINNDPVLIFGLDVDVPGSPATAEIRQRTPRFVVGAVIPGSTVQVVADPKDPSVVAIDWTQAPQPGAGVVGGVGPGMDEISEQMGEPVAGVGSAAELLRKGRRGTAVIRSATDSGDISDLGLVDSTDAGRDDRIYVFDLEVKLPGRSPYQARVGHRVPERLYGKVAPGMEIEVAVDRDNDQEVAIDWSDI